MAHLIQQKYGGAYLTNDRAFAKQIASAYRFDSYTDARNFLRNNLSCPEAYAIIEYNPVPTADVVMALRAILGEIGPDMMRYASIQQAYDLMEQIDARGHE